MSNHHSLGRSKHALAATKFLGAEPAVFLVQKPMAVPVTDKRAAHRISINEGEAH
jgi:hypothetical protein